MVAYVEGILNKLGLPYRILRLCAGDLTFASALTYDFEVYSAAQDKWLEVSSVSNFETFQTNRMKCRFKDANGKTQLAHTLNGSALALARIVASLLENYQTPEGIEVPEVLRSRASALTLARALAMIKQDIMKYKLSLLMIGFLWISCSNKQKETDNTPIKIVNEFNYEDVRRRWNSKIYSRS